jgi:hypothetical protein
MAVPKGESFRRAANLGKRKRKAGKGVGFEFNDHAVASMLYFIKPEMDNLTVNFQRLSADELKDWMNYFGRYEKRWRLYLRKILTRPNSRYMICTLNSEEPTFAKAFEKGGYHGYDTCTGSDNRCNFSPLFD